MISFDEALSRLLGTVSPLSAERVSLEDAASRVLAQQITAQDAMPSFDYSSMDGYALLSTSLTASGPWTLPVVGESTAGGLAPKLQPGTACRIFTGAQLPEGADAVVPQEDVQRSGDSIALQHAPQCGAWIRHRGDDLAQGAIALHKGTRLGPGQVALAAALDHPYLFVARKPIVTVLCSGDELRSPGQPGGKGTIAESNGYFIGALGRAAGALVRMAPFVVDDPDLAAAAVVNALRGTDLLITVGGVSVGDRDVMRPALERAGVTLDFWRVAMKPGKPLAVGRFTPAHASTVHVLGLPGNPASASLTFALFGVPVIRALQGDAAPLPTRLGVRAAFQLRRQVGRLEFLRARLVRRDMELLAVASPNQASGAVTSFAEAEALVMVPADCAVVNEGDKLEAVRLNDI